jgi:hypothetical protein
MWKEGFMAYFKVLSWQFPQETEKKPGWVSDYLVFRPRFETGPLEWRPEVLQVELSFTVRRIKEGNKVEEEEE